MVGSGGPGGEHALAAALAAFLRREYGESYCDECLAFTLRLDLDAVRRATEVIGRAFSEFVRLPAECDQCARFSVITAMR